jgi:catalase
VGTAEREEQGDKLSVRAELFAEHYSHARLFWRSMTESEQAHIASSFTFELSKVVPEQVPPRMVANLRNVDEGLAERVAAGVGIGLPRKSGARSEVLDLDPLQGRKVAILYTDGSDGAEIKTVQEAIEKEGATIFLVAPKIGGAKLTGRYTVLKANGQLAGPPRSYSTPSPYVTGAIDSEEYEEDETRMNEAAAVQFVMDAFGHLKAIGASKSAKPLLDKAGVVPDDGVTGLTKDFVEAARMRFWDRERLCASSREPERVRKNLPVATASAA